MNQLQTKIVVENCYQLYNLNLLEVMEIIDISCDDLISKNIIASGWYLLILTICYHFVHKPL